MRDVESKWIIAAIMQQLGEGRITIPHARVVDLSERFTVEIDERITGETTYTLRRKSSEAQQEIQFESAFALEAVPNRLAAEVTSK